MRLFEAIIDANHRAVAGDQSAGLHPTEFEGELPVVALTCIDVRLNPLLPEVLGVPKEQFIWLRNAGNIITGPLSSTMRSLALACVVKGGKEIAVIGHTDCQVGKTTTADLIDRFRALGVERHLLPANVNEFFGMFASERANVIKAVDVVRHSPLIGPKIPVHGLLVDIETGKVEWLVNGYQTLDVMGAHESEATSSAGHTLDAMKSLTDFEIGGIKFPETKIGETVTQAEDWLSGKVHQMQTGPSAATPAAPPEIPVLQASARAWLREKEHAKPAVPPKIPLPQPMRPKLRFTKGPK
jgi:carbonic anhydrase